MVVVKLVASGILSFASTAFLIWLGSLVVKRV
jgi:hypothetical protein